MKWVDERERHPLDAFELHGMLECRDEVEEEAEVAGDPRVFALVDEIDVR